jgi:hypothetical protein
VGSVHGWSERRPQPQKPTPLSPPLCTTLYIARTVSPSMPLGILQRAMRLAPSLNSIGNGAAPLRKRSWLVSKPLPRPVQARATERDAPHFQSHAPSPAAVITVRLEALATQRRHRRCRGCSHRPSVLELGLEGVEVFDRYRGEDVAKSRASLHERGTEIVFGVGGRRLLFAAALGPNPEATSGACTTRLP